MIRNSGCIFVIGDRFIAGANIGNDKQFFNTEIEVRTNDILTVLFAEILDKDL